MIDSTRSNPRGPCVSNDVRTIGRVVHAARDPGVAVFVSIVAVGCGSALGALLRWQVGVRLNRLFPRMPPGTLAVNVVGGYLIGIAVALLAARPDLSPTWRLFVVTGFLGGLTTFSTFSAEVVAQALAGRLRWAAATVVTHVVGSVAMTMLGIWTVSVLVRG